MAILAQCPKCKARQPVTDKWCRCGEHLDKAKKSSRMLKKSDKLPEVMRGSRLTFKGLSEWYTGLESVKARHVFIADVQLPASAGNSDRMSAFLNMTRISVAFKK